MQIDTLAHGFKYQPEKRILNKFDVFTEIFVTPIDILLSQKIYAAMNRKRAKGRDFFDVVFLLSLTKPNYQYLKLKIGVDTAAKLRSKFGEATSKIDFKELGQDVRNFLFNATDVKRVELFGEFIARAKLD